MMETVRDIVEEIASLADDAETRALFGERMTALSLILKASRLYNEFAPFINTFADTNMLAARIAIIARSLCGEVAANDE